eukprot:TRINITY_DN4662_c0_g1_i8.p1 TRINITY_DN4662_c0_g1~~TRINITY_DN4662_c0_g1_i8.p1  ORF type:complete len:389 (+),score=78.71 TRINITY_DN4662_c0_g1_i8:254-1420(+)
MRGSTRLAWLVGLILVTTVGLLLFHFEDSLDDDADKKPVDLGKWGTAKVPDLLQYLPPQTKVKPPQTLSIKKLGIEPSVQQLLTACPAVEQVKHEDIELLTLLSHRKYHWVYEAKRRSNGARVVVRLLTRDGFFARELDVTSRLCQKCTTGMNYATGVVESGAWKDKGKEIGFTGRGIMYPHLSDMQSLDLAVAPYRVDDKLPEALYYHVAASILDLLQCMHSQGVMHRDMKTSNVFARVEHGQLKATEIIDFGSAQLADPVEKHVLLVGTMQFKPPDLMLGLRSYGPSIDIWETGVLLMNLLLGSPKNRGMWALPSVAATQDGASGAAKGQRRMLEKHAALLGAKCILATASQYQDQLDLGMAAAFKSESVGFIAHFSKVGVASVCV